MYFPIYIDLSDKEILIVGGGGIAARRVGALLGFAGRMTVVALEVSEALQEIERRCKVPALTICRRAFSEKDLEGKFLVLAATDDHALNQRIYDLCRRRNILVNVCSDQKLCDFQFPSIVQNKEVVIGINASGKNHGLVKETRKRLEQFLEIGETEKRYRE